jgi:catechol 2,3-dioxygenase-like lactoylglutathione lyase family enzyme
MPINVKGLAWLGVKTDKFEEMCHFYESILALDPVHDEEGFKAYDLPNGDRIEVFSSEVPYHHDFKDAPVAGFLVGDIQSAKIEMEKSGIEFTEDIEGDPKRTQWAHFRGPDGNIYELKSRAGETD